MSTELQVAQPAQVQVIRSSEADHFMPVMAMERAVQRYNAIVQFTQEIMKPGKDYGSIPGTDKPTLLKPGAEKLCSFFGLTPKFALVERTELWDGAEPFFYYFYKCQLWRGDHLIGEGDGSANSKETKYRYRWVQENNLPPGLDKAKCEARGGRITEFDFAIDKAETTGKYGKPASYWQAFKSAIENGTAAKGTKEVKNGGSRPTWTIDSTVYRVPNPEVCDAVNTLQKMSQKRAFIAAVLIACNASEYYTQDVEDLDTIDNFSGIDLGGNKPNTQAAANHVAEQKIQQQQREAEDLKKRQAAAPPQQQERQQQTRREDPPPTQKAADELPAPVQAMWSRMQGIKPTLEVFAELKRDLIELLGEDSGNRYYYGALGKQGVEHANQFKSAKPARFAAREMLECIMAAKEPNVVTDADALPDFDNDERETGYRGDVR